MTTPIASAESGGDSSSLIMALSERSNDRLRKLLTTYVMVGAAGRVLKGWWARTKAMRTYTVGVPGDDDLFQDVHRWLIEQLPPQRRRAELARTTRPGYGMLVSAEPESIGGSRPQPPSIKLLYDGTATQTIEIDGHRIHVHVDRPGQDQTRDDRPPPAWIADLYRVVFTCASVEARDAVEKMLDGLAAARADDPHRVYVANAWDWRRQPTQPRRKLNSVVLRAGQLEELVADVGDFLGREAEYANLGIPYHRGFLFEGPPGCGKTSAAKVIADHFGLDVYYMPLPVVADDARLVMMLNEVQPRSLLLLEDVDIVHAARDRSDSQPGVSMGGLLNALDGFVTPHGMITIMTTNHAAVLDDALVRPGRVDRVERMDLADDEQLGRLLEAMVPGCPGHLPFIPQPVSPAAVIEVVKRNLGQPDKAYAEVCELLVQGSLIA